MKPKMTKEMAPMDAKSFTAVCKLKTDNFDTGNYWILHGVDIITLAEQEVGNPAAQGISIPKQAFDKMVAWYLRKQKISPSRT